MWYKIVQNFKSLWCLVLEISTFHYEARHGFRAGASVHKLFVGGVYRLRKYPSSWIYAGFPRSLYMHYCVHLRNWKRYRMTGLVCKSRVRADECALMQSVRVTAKPNNRLLGDAYSIFRGLWVSIAICCVLLVFDEDWFYPCSSGLYLPDTCGPFY